MMRLLQQFFLMGYYYTFWRKGSILHILRLWSRDHVISSKSEESKNNNNNNYYHKRQAQKPQHISILIRIYKKLQVRENIPPWLTRRHSNSSTTSVWPTKVWTGAAWLLIFHRRRLFSPLRNWGTTTVTSPSPNGCKDNFMNTSDHDNIMYAVSRSISRTHTVYLALQTGSVVVRTPSALRGFVISNNLTVPSWLDVASWSSWSGLQSSPCI